MLQYFKFGYMTINCWISDVGRYDQHQLINISIEYGERKGSLVFEVVREQLN